MTCATSAAGCGKHIEIYDTTLRDGEQREGISISLKDKLLIAARLDVLGVDYIEGGFPGSNPKDREFFERVGSLQLTHARVVAFGSTCRKGVAACDDEGLAAIVATGMGIATIVGKAWDVQVTRALRTTLRENLRMVSDSVTFLKGHMERVFFDAEHFFDGYKANPRFAMQVLAAAIEAGADAVVLCDTNGGCMPDEIFSIVSDVTSAFPQTTVGIHTHDDCGVACANSLEAVRAGATQVQVTMNGYGERVGNADLSVVVPDLELKCGYTVIGPERMQKLTSTSAAIAEILNVPQDPHRPYVGASAFAHKGGLHASAIARFPEAYEHVHPSQVGNLSRFVVSELAGRASLLAKSNELGVDLSDDEKVCADALRDIKSLENEGYSFELADASLELLLRAEKGLAEKHFRLESFRVIADKRADGQVMTEATIKIHVGDERFIATAEGNGPVNALDRALRMAITRFYPEITAIELTDYKVRVLDESLGTDAVTRVLIESSDGVDTWNTIGVSPNIIEASWNALVDSIEYGLRKVAAR